MLDLRKAYHHISLHPESWPLMLTMTPLGPCQYIKIPLGLKDSGAVSQRAIHETLQDCPSTVPYIDNILVYGKTKQEHNCNLERFYMRSKCFLVLSVAEHSEQLLVAAVKVQVSPDHHSVPGSPPFRL